MKKSLLLNRKMHFFHYPNKRLLYSKFFTFLKKKIINKKFIYFSGGRSFLRIHEKINYEKKLFRNKFFYLVDERLTNSRKFSNYLKLRNKIKEKSIFIFNYLQFYKKGKKIELIKKCIKEIPDSDLSILSIGSDGHIASIFSNNINKKNFFFYIVKQKNENFERITMSEEKILRSKMVIFLLNTKKKSLFIKDIENPIKVNIPFLRFCRKYKKKIYIFYI